MSRATAGRGPTVAFACDRWLLGPEATGALWLAEPDDSRPRRELPRTMLIGLARSIGWLEMYDSTARVSPDVAHNLAILQVGLRQQGRIGGEHVA